MMNWDVLKDGEESFGMFYPRHYTLAGFPDRQAAEAAAVSLVSAGFAEANVHVVRGDELIAKIDQQEADHGWFDRLRARIAEFIGTETYFIDQDITLARRGGAFVLVYTPDDEDGRRVTAILTSHEAEYARRYLNMAIERLIEPSASIQRDAEMRGG